MFVLFDIRLRLVNVRKFTTELLLKKCCTTAAHMLTFQVFLDCADSSNTISLLIALSLFLTTMLLCAAVMW